MPLCIENSDKCIKPGCFLKRCKEQGTLYCYPHSMLYFAQNGLPIRDEAHASKVFSLGVTHFASGYRIWNTLPTGFHYYVPPWHYLRQN